MNQRMRFALSQKAKHRIVTNSLVSWWDFRGGYKTGTVVDRMGGNDGTVESATPAEFWAEGKRGMFDGVGSVVNFGVAPSLGVTGAFTIEAWVSFNTIAVNHGIFSHWTSAPLRGFRLWYHQSSGNMRVDVSDDGSGYKLVFSSGISFISNTVYHVVANYEPSSYIDIYVDGVRYANETVGIPGSLYDPAIDFIMGAADTAPNHIMDGKFYVTRLYNAALSEAGVVRNFKAERREFG